MLRTNPSSQLKPFPMAPYVYVTEETAEIDIARYLTDIKACGFDAFRPGYGPEFLSEHEIDFSGSDLFFRLAQEIGLKVLPHFQMGYRAWMGEEPHHIDPKRYLLDDEYHRLLDIFFTAVVTRYREHPCLLGWIGIGEPGSFPEPLEQDPQVRKLYLAWLQAQYGSTAHLERAWGIGSRLYNEHRQVPGWNDGERWAGRSYEKYRQQRDIMRFRTEFLLEKMTTCERAMMRADDGHPVVTGIHNVLANTAAKTWDFALQASRADGLMSSIHAGWHSWLGDFEFFLPLYVQARMTRDFAKGKWAIPYETTGGPNFRTADRGFNMNPCERSQMILGYLAAGLQGGGFWTWNARLTGDEAGEFALTTLQGELGARARLLGSYARQMQKWSGELYDAKAECCAAVLYSWENEAFCACDKLTHARSMQRDAGSRHRLGVARSLTNANIPWEFVTDGELVDGAVLAYPVLIVPGMPLVSHAAMKALAGYVERGGTLIVDMPFGIYDEFGRVRTEGAGGEYDRLLGAYPTDIFATFDEPMTIRDLPVQGCFSELAVTAAVVRETFGDGRPAVLEHKLGAGRVACFAFEVCSRCAAPGEDAFERLLTDAVLSGRCRLWTCQHVLAFRRQVPNVDYYYLINPGDEVSTEVYAFDTQYRTVWDVMGERDLTTVPLPDEGGCAIPIRIPRGQGSWLRCERI